MEHWAIANALLLLCNMIMLLAFPKKIENGRVPKLKYRANVFVVLTAMLGIVCFIFTQNVYGQMVICDHWTIPMILFCGLEGTAKLHSRIFLDN